MPAIPSLSQCVPSLSPRSSYQELPTLHVSGDRAMDREARVMRCAACSARSHDACDMPGLPLSPDIEDNGGD